MNIFKFFLPLTILLASCSSESELNLSDEFETIRVVDVLSRNSENSPYNVTDEEIKKIVTEYEPMKTASLNSSQSSPTGYTESIIYDNSGNPAIFVINYDNDKGFVLISATKTMPPVLAYNDKGHYDVNSDENGAKSFWETMILEQFEIAKTLEDDEIAPTAALWNKYENKSYNPLTLDSEDPMFTDPDFQTVSAKLRTQRSMLDNGGTEFYGPTIVMDGTFLGIFIRQEVVH